MRIDDWMTQSQVAFGTSGARGLVSDMTDAVCYAYTLGFLAYLRSTGQWRGGEVGIAGDLRASTPRIMSACARAISDVGGTVINGGFIPSPAIALFGLSRHIPTLMVTGSHIPEDRNGIKFNLPTGEVLKRDEAGIRTQWVTVSPDLFDARGMFRAVQPLPPVEPTPYRQYVARFTDFFPEGCLRGLRLGLYEHSSVGRQLFGEVLSALGAHVTRLGRSETFVSVDTEAIRPEDVVLGRQWGQTGMFDALISADGDADRPLVSDEAGIWLRGDIAGILCARYLEARGVVTPVSSNTALELSGWFEPVVRTRIGSPYVIEGMQSLVAGGNGSVVGYEANGGFLQATPLTRDGRTLEPLPTRDALIVALSILMLARTRACPVSHLLMALPQRFTHSDRIQDFPTAESQRRLAQLQTGDAEADARAIQALFGGQLGGVQRVDTTDGLRIVFEGADIVHLRPSGNAPELRAYTEASSPNRAQALNALCLTVLRGWRAEVLGS
ncbi:MAG: phosphomannomutase [Myxococcota bacterium]